MTIEIRELRREDAGAVARLFKASDPVWPGGFADNTLYPDEAILEELDEEETLNIYLAWAGDQVVGFGSLHPVQGHKDVGYLGLLAADPSYHGKGVGRDLIFTIIKRCTELGFKRLDLDTWPGNFRAVPLYKKTGFQWGLESEELENYMPLLLSHPLTKPYFDRTDWYKCQKRGLALGPDDERRDGALVYRYEWRSQHGSLTALFDQKTHKLVELHTPELSVSLRAHTDALLSGGELRGTLTVENRGRSPLPVAVTATGGGPVEADLLHASVVSPGDADTIALTARTEQPREGDGSIDARLLLGEHELQLSASLKVHAAVELSAVPELPQLLPGVPRELTLNLRNRTKRDVAARLTLQQVRGVRVMAADTTVPISALGTAATRLTITATAPGMYELTGTVVTGESEKPEPFNVALPVSAPGEVLTYEKDKRITLLTRDLAVQVGIKGATLKLMDRATGQALGTLDAAPGPPFWPEKLGETEFTALVERGRSGAVVRLSAELPDCPGVRVERVVSLRGDGRVGTSVELHNGRPAPVQHAMHLSRRLPEGEEEAAYPLGEGVIRGFGGEPAWASFGTGSNLPLSQRWIAHRVNGWWMGLFWPEQFAIRSSYRSWHRVALRSPMVTVRPGESWHSGQVEILATRAGWEQIEREWQLEAGAELRQSRVRPAAGAEASPSPVFLTGTSVDLELRAWSYFPRPSTGTLRLTGTGLTVRPDSIDLPELANDTEWSGSVRATSEVQDPAAAELLISSTLPHAVTEAAVPIYITRRGERVRVSKGEQLGFHEVENGWMSYRVAPDKLGGIVSLRSMHGESLWSSYPEPATRSWMYPVHGGIHPVLWERDHGHSQSSLGRLYGLPFEAEPAERVDRQGLLWQGVVVEAAASHEALPGISLRVEYLTLPGSNILAVVSTLISSGGAVPVQYRLHTSPEYQSELPLLLQPDQHQVARGLEQAGLGYRGRQWTAVEYPSTGRSFVLVNASQGYIDAWAIGIDGTVLDAVLEDTVPARGQLVSCSYIVLAGDRTQAARYAELSHLAFPTE